MNKTPDIVPKSLAAKLINRSPALVSKWIKHGKLEEIDIHGGRAKWVNWIDCAKLKRK